MKKLVTFEQLEAIIDSIKRGKFLNIYFERVWPKCTDCGKKDKEWVKTKPIVCPYCGGLISYERKAQAQLGVHNPKDVSIRPKGVGESFAEKRAKGLIGFYDTQLCQYRECHVDKIMRLAVDGDEYFPVKV